MILLSSVPSKLCMCINIEEIRSITSLQINLSFRSMLPILNDFFHIKKRLSDSIFHIRNRQFKVSYEYPMPSYFLSLSRSATLPYLRCIGLSRPKKQRYESQLIPKICRSSIEQCSVNIQKSQCKCVACIRSRTGQDCMKLPLYLSPYFSDTVPLIQFFTLPCKYTIAKKIIPSIME